MPAPPKLPSWATGAASILEPSDGKKAQGWVPGEQPPASFFNYWQNLVGQWVADLSSRTAALEAAVMAPVLTALPASAAVAGLAGGYTALGAIGFDADDGRWIGGFTSAGSFFAAGGAINAPSDTRTGSTGLPLDTYGVTFVQTHWMAFGQPAGLLRVTDSSGTLTSSAITGTARVWMAAASDSVNTIVLSDTDSFYGRVPIGSTACTEVAGTGNFAGAMQRCIVWDGIRDRFVVVFGNGNTMISTDHGVTWSAAGAHGLTGGGLLSLAHCRESDLLAVCAKSAGALWTVRVSADGGTTWTDAGLTPAASANVWEVFDGFGALWVRGVDASLRWALEPSRWQAVSVPGGAHTTLARRGAFRGLCAPPNGAGVGRLIYVAADAKLRASGPIRAANSLVVDR